MNERFPAREPGRADAAGPGPDNPVEALIRHNINAQNSAQARFTRLLMLAVVAGVGGFFVATNLPRLIRDGAEPMTVLPVLAGVFMILWAPYGWRQLRADQARQTAAAEWQLEQAKAARLRDGREF
jgi:hypothetical protein